MLYYTSILLDIRFILYICFYFGCKFTAKEKQGFGICSQKLVSCSNTLSKSSEKHI